MKQPRLYRKNKPRPLQYLKDLYAKWVFERDRDFCETLEPVFAQSKSTGCDYSELLTLYNHVRRNRPSSILELGSGVSTAVIAHAVRALARTGHECRFVSLEESPEYHAQLLSIFPEALKPYAEMLQSPTEDRPLPGGFIARLYRDKPKLAYDMVFIDGPQVPKTGGYFDGDILDVMDWNPKPFVAFLDQRIATRTILRKLLPFARMRADREFARFDIPELASRPAISANPDMAPAVA